MIRTSSPDLRYIVHRDAPSFADYQEKAPEIGRLASLVAEINACGYNRFAE